MHVQLLVDVAHVGLGGAVGDEQLPLDHAHGLALGQKPQDFQLARCQVVLGRQLAATIGYALGLLVGYVLRQLFKLFTALCK